MSPCIDCKWFQSDTSMCNHEFAQDIAAYIWGKLPRRVHVDVASVRLQDWACGRDGKWWEAAE